MSPQQFASERRFNFGIINTMRIVAPICLLLYLASSALAIKVAVLGDNLTDDTINNHFGAGSATLVTDAQLATAGFLSTFDAVYITRDGSSFGAGLSAAAAARVQTYVGATGNVVLLLGDYADDLGITFAADPNIQQLTYNAVSFATASGHGYIGEFNGATMGLTANADGYIPLGFISGSATTSLSSVGSLGDGNVNLIPPHPVVAGLPNPISNPVDLEYSTLTTGIPIANIVARYANNNGVAVVVRGVPEPTTVTLLGVSILWALGRRLRRQ